MQTTVYLIRHSEPDKRISNVISYENLQLWNEKNILSVNGELKASQLSQIDEMKNIDVVISSNYVRAISTAKYIANVNDKDIKVIENFGERKFGINNWEEKPKDFTTRQIEDENFKINNGESRKETANRMYDALFSVLDEYKGKRIAIVSHATAITFLFMKMFGVNDMNICFNNKIIIDEDFVWDAPMVFKLTFEDDELIDITNLRLEGKFIVE